MTQDLEKTLWAAADKLRNNMDAAEYKHPDMRIKKKAKLFWRALKNRQYKNSPKNDFKR
jgi:type I restriction-modification system DNA methylase subunit